MEGRLGKLATFLPLVWKDSRFCIICMLYLCQTSVDSVRALLSDVLIVSPII